MKKYIIIIGCIFSMICFSSCKKALTEKMHSAISPGNFYKSAADAESALNGVFAVFPQYDYYGRSVYIIADGSSDIFEPALANAPRIELFRGEYTPQNSLLNAWWRHSYTMIKNANDVITYVPGIDMDVVKRNSIVGNAYFLRAMCHFNLVRGFGDVPLVVGKSGENELFPARTPADLVYKQIIEDLKFAEANCLHANQIPASQIGRVSSEAASAMLARVYLQRASTGFAVSSDNQSALDAANKVISFSTTNPNVISLNPVYSAVFDSQTKNGTESIFAVQFGASPAITNITPLMFDPPSLGGYGSFVALNSFVNTYANDDVRRQSDIGIVVANRYYISKHNDPRSITGAEGLNNQIVLRYADVLLMQSEALNNLNPADPNKFEGINKIRTRAGLGSSLLNFVNTPSSAAFIDSLSDERLRELAIEGHRRYDLLRFKKYKQVKAAQGLTISDGRLLFPIPQADRDVNPNLSQNPGY